MQVARCKLIRAIRSPLKRQVVIFFLTARQDGGPISLAENQTTVMWNYLKKLHLFPKCFCMWKTYKFRVEICHLNQKGL